jgi:hypothetical protein
MSYYLQLQAQQSQKIIPMNDDLPIFARIVDQTGNPISYIASVGIVVYDLENNATTYTGGGSGGSYVSSLSTTNWTTDATGYNFLAIVPGSAFSVASTYQVEVTLIPSLGDPLTFTAEVHTLPVY